MAPDSLLQSLSALRFQNTLVESLPADGQSGGGPRPVEGAGYAFVPPKGFAAPRTLALAREVAELLGLSEEACADPEFAAVFSGSQLLEGMQPYALAYGGHQFGHWAGQLGDGRAINLGQSTGPDGVRRVLQLKGAGPTPFSRQGDGFAVLRSSVREFLCSEAMHHLGVPTTRALCLVDTGAQVPRDMFYDGNEKLEPGAVVCRVSRCFTRFGTFELPASRGDVDLLRKLAEYSLREEFPELNAPPAGEEIPAELFLEWFRSIADRTSELMVHWMRVGFVHGVMNTDNLSVLGETIDYGPYGWVDDFDPDWTPNTTDAGGRRYRFGNQASIAHWNLTRLASAIVPLVGDVAPLQEIADEWPVQNEVAYGVMMASKLGLKAHAGETDKALIADLRGLLCRTETDMTLFFRGLAKLPVAAGMPDRTSLIAALGEAYYADLAVQSEVLEVLEQWSARYAARVQSDGTSDAERAQAMNATNPLYVLRNFQAQLAIDAAEKGDTGVMHKLLEVLRNPYAEQTGQEAFATKRPEWARHRPGCSTLSCSS
ncbi:MAG: hypothetical protein ACI8QC_004428 [Planctomycetota bacterium]|jgi:uncharacterized protein YdiU (UPF0061 family)